MEFSVVSQNMSVATSSAECILSGGLQSFVLKICCFEIPNMLLMFFIKRKL